MNEQQRHYTETYLVPVIEAKIAKNEPEWVLDSLLQPCSTHGCVAGDVGLRMLADGVQLGSLMLLDNFLDNTATSYSDRFVGSVYGCFEELFGFTEYFDNKEFDVFGDSESGTLQQRLDYVNSQLEKHNETI